MWPRPPLTWPSGPASGSFCHEAAVSTALCIYVYFNLCSEKSFVLLSIKLTSHNSLRFFFFKIHFFFLSCLKLESSPNHAYNEIY